MKSESNARLALPPNKKIIGAEETDQEDSKKRQYIEKKVIDFSAKNRFKSPGPILKGQVPKVPLKQIQSGITKETKEEETEMRDLKSERKNERSPVPSPKDELKQGKPQEKETKVDEKKEDLNLDCVICFNQRADMVCMPCGHSGICKQCSIKVCSKEALCFLCKKPIEQLLQIDLTRTIGGMVIVLSSISISSPENES